MEVANMRSAISKAYDGPKWKERVKWMADNQVIAIYYKFKETGKLNKKTRKDIPEAYEEIQMSIWDILN